jgi:hypothetical protein
MADLKVNYQLLDTAGRSISSLRQEFNGLQGQEQGFDSALGSAEIASAMDGFAGNWDYHRRLLVSSMEALDTMVQDSKQKFQSTDNALKTSLTKK